MSTDNWRKDLGKKSRQAVDRYLALQSELSRSGSTIQPGDIFLFDLEMSLPLEWAVVFADPEADSLWFLVAADQSPFVSKDDIEVPTSAQSGPRTLRCGHGLWISSGLLLTAARSGRLEEHFVELAHDRYQQIESNNLTPSHEQLELESDLECREWLEQVAAGVDSLDRHLRSLESPEPLVVLESGYRLDWFKGMSRAGWPLETPLAADAGGLSVLPQDAKSEPLGQILEDSSPGVLVALIYPNGVMLEYFPSEGESPPVVEWCDTTGEPIQLEWNSAPSGARFGAETISWQDDVVEFQLDGRPVTAHRPSGDDRVDAQFSS